MKIQAVKFRTDGFMTEPFAFGGEDGIKILYEELHNAYPQYKFEIMPDVDVSTTE